MKIHTRCLTSMISPFLLLWITVSAAYGQVIAREDFDGGALNLTSSSVPALDGGPGDYFGVGSRNTWPQGTPPGVPFSIGDDSVIPYSDPVGGAVVPDDSEGVYGQNSDFDNSYFAISDSDEFGAEQAASWTFNIAGATNLVASLELGGISNDSFGGFSPDTSFIMTAQIDGGPVQTLFSLAAVDADPSFATRPMDSGGPSGGGRLLLASGDNAVTKILADTGMAADNLYLDKTPADGSGAGQLDTFSTALDGTGSELVISLTVNMPFEAVVFDNLVVTSVPEPTSTVILVSSLLGMGLVRRRRAGVVASRRS